MVPNTAMSLSRVCQIKITQEQGPFRQYLKGTDLKDEGRACISALPAFLVGPCAGSLAALGLRFFLYHRGGNNGF